MEELRSFFYAQNQGRNLDKCSKIKAVTNNNLSGGGRITLACTECKQRNYNMTKDKKTHPDRMETKKYCRFCKTHTLHKETK